MMKQLVVKKNRYPYIGNPFGFKLPEPKPVIHPVISKWDDFTEDKKEIIRGIKKVIVSYIGECEVRIFGSMIKGNWDEDSDYDLIILKRPEEDIIKQIKNHNFGVKVYTKFYEPSSVSLNGSILIEE